MTKMPEYRVVRNGRAKRLRLRLFPNGELRVTAPVTVSECEIAAFVAAQRDWIARHREGLEPSQWRVPPQRIELAALDETWRPCWGSGQAGIDDRNRVLSIPHAYDHDGREWLRQWLMARARMALAPWLARQSARTGLSFARLRIATQKTRWGSCSSRGTISLNARMLLLPPRLVDYLLVHELCHTRHLHHGAAFWALVEQHCKDYRAAERELDRVARVLPAWSHFSIC